MRNLFEESFLGICVLFVALFTFFTIQDTGRLNSAIDKADFNTLENNPYRLRFAYEKGMFDDGFISNREYGQIPPESILEKIYKKDKN